MRSISLLALASAIVAAPAGTVELQVNHHNPALMGPVHEQIVRQFEALHPDVDVVLDARSRNYEAQMQALLRDVTIGRQPDVVFTGLHLVRLLVDRGLAVSLRPLMAAEPDWKTLGYPRSSLSLTEQAGEVYALPFAISVLIIYYNLDLVARAGADPDALPADWPGIVDLAARIEALGEPVTGGYLEYDNSGNWSFQALLASQGQRMMGEDDRTIRFAGPEGLRALEILRGFGERAGQVAMSQDQARSQFAAGTLGVYVSSSSSLGTVEKGAAGRFALATTPIPLSTAQGRLPAGGNAAVMLARDPETQRAAWEYVKFATGPEGQTVMAPRTGYVPGNEIAIRDERYLARFYGENPAHLTAARQLPLITGWYSFPGQNALKITDVIKGHLESVVTLKATPEGAMAAMAADVRALLPNE